MCVCVLFFVVVLKRVILRETKQQTAITVANVNVSKSMIEFWLLSQNHTLSAHFIKLIRRSKIYSIPVNLSNVYLNYPLTITKIDQKTNNEIRDDVLIFRQEIFGNKNKLMATSPTFKQTSRCRFVQSS